MNIEDIIIKKKNKKELTSDEICFAINGYLKKTVNRKNMIDFLKAIYDNGMTKNETFLLTKCMVGSEKTFNKNNKIYADKHSTGGISDSTTLLIAPIVACAGINFYKMSGLKLGFTGGTVEKLLCFKGYNTEISFQESQKLLKKNGAVLMSFSEINVPADKQIYQLRDEENLVISIPLIASSIMSKKIASGNDVIVLDVKCGNGAFMKNKKEAKELAKYMLEIGKLANKKVATIISDMNQPLGSGIGSLLEVIDVITILRNPKIDSRLKNLSIFLSAKIIELAKNISFDKAIKLAESILYSGKALRKFKKIIKSQGGSLNLFYEKNIENILKNPIILYSKKEGYLNKFNLEKLGYLTRKYCSDGNYGIKILVQLGDCIEKNTPIIELYNKETSLDFLSCIHYSKNKKNITDLIIDVI